MGLLTIQIRAQFLLRAEGTSAFPHSPLRYVYSKSCYVVREHLITSLPVVGALTLIRYEELLICDILVHRCPWEILDRSFLSRSARRDARDAARASETSRRERRS